MYNKFFILLTLIIIIIKSAYSEELTPEQIILNLYKQNTSGKIQTLVMDGDVFTPDGKDGNKKSMTVKVFFSYPGKIRIEKTVIIPGASNIYAIVIRNGKIEWVFLPIPSFDRCSKKIDTHYHSSFLPFNIDCQPQDQYRTYNLIGIEKIDNRDAYVIEIKNENDPFVKYTKVWIDKERFVPLKEENILKKEENKTNQEDKEIKKVVIYKNIKQLIDGRWIPFEMELYENDKRILTIVYNNISVNQELKEHLFNPDVPFEGDKSN